MDQRDSPEHMSVGARGMDQPVSQAGITLETYTISGLWVLTYRVSPVPVGIWGESYLYW